MNAVLFLVICTKTGHFSGQVKDVTVFSPESGSPVAAGPGRKGGPVKAFTTAARFLQI
ncbi:MAG: hypothetical protein MSA06_03895 [Clostridiales bacterium]|nr:hypothetical protein [Clostridiales bacterium]